MASIPLIFLVVFSLHSLIERVTSHYLRRIVIALTGIVIAFLGYAAHKQTTTWATDISLLEHAVKLYPASVPGRVSLAAAYREAEHYESEEKVLKEGMKMTDHVSYHTALGSVYVRQKKFDDARREYERGMALDDKNPEPHFFLGSLLEEEQKTLEALASYRKAIALDESYVAAYNNAGAILRDTKDLQGAEAMFRKAIEWNPSFMEGEYNLFEILESTNRSDEALPHLEKAYALNQESSDLALSLGYQYSIRKRTQDALRVINEALENDPENRSLNRLKQSINLNIKASP